MSTCLSLLRALLVATGLSGFGTLAAHAACADVEVQRSYRADDLDGLQAAATRMPSEGDLPALVARGLATYLAVNLLLSQEQPARARGLLGDSVALLERSWATQAHPELGALLALLYGQTIGIQPWKGLWLGPRSDRVLAAAMQTSPENPRLIYALAIGLLYKPAAVGGSPQKAAQELRRALILFAQQRPSPEACWGRDQAELALAQAHLHMREPSAATAAVQALLERVPDHLPAQRLLRALPSSHPPAR